VVGGTVHALTELPGPVLAHCASGLRSAVAWAAAAARGQSVDLVLERLAAAGFNFEPLRDELEDQHDPGHISPIPAALAVSPA
jgi:sulfide:quinone oxidoreductase